MNLDSLHEKLTDARTMIDEVLGELQSALPAEPPQIRDNLQQALDAAAPGATLILAPGQTFVGNFTMPETPGLIVRADNATIVTPDTVPALMWKQGASGHLWSKGEVTGPRPDDLIRVGSSVETIAERQPSRIVFDGMNIHGDPVKGAKRGIAAHGSAITLRDSRVWDIKRDGQETQAIWISNGPGPYTIVDNVLEASGINILVGGDDPRIANLTPTGITIEENIIWKPTEWLNAPWDVKNLLELKNAKDVTIRRNVFDGTWPDAQSGYALLVSPRNQGGTAPWSGVSNVAVTHNVFRNVSSVFKVTGDDDFKPSQRVHTIRLAHNLAVTDNSPRLTKQGRTKGEGRFLLVQRGPQQLLVEHNTSICDGPAWAITEGGGALETVGGAVFDANVFYRRSYGFKGGQTVEGLGTLARYYPDAWFKGQVIIDGKASMYPLGNFTPTAGEAEKYFEADWSWKADSPWKETGCDFSLLPGKV